MDDFLCIGMTLAIVKIDVNSPLWKKLSLNYKLTLIYKLSLTYKLKISANNGEISALRRWRIFFGKLLDPWDFSDFSSFMMSKTSIESVGDMENELINESLRK